VKVCIAFDSFKDCVTSRDLSLKLSHILNGDNDLEFNVLPIADGGEGSLDAINASAQFKEIRLTVKDPLQRPIDAYYLINEQKNEAYIELSVASGIERLKKAQRNCWVTTAYGTGELIADAIARQVNHIYLFLGSSSTTEMGVSLAAACGWQFQADGVNINIPLGRDLLMIDDIKKPDTATWPSFTACADVSNPLYGDRGAAIIYGPQKGASEEHVLQLDNGLKRIADIVQKKFNKDIVNVKGAGAAGGIGAGAQAFFDANIKSGFKLISEAIDLEKAIEDCDVIITGEGCFDGQSFNGKGVHRIITLAKEKTKRVIVICGISNLTDEERAQLGDCVVYDLSAIFKHKHVSKENTYNQLEQLKEQIITSII